MLDHRVIELTRLTGRSQDQALPVLVDEALRHDGIALVVLQMGLGHQLIEIAQTQLVFRQDDEVFGLALGLTRAPELGHGRVDGLEGVDPPVLQHPEEGHQHIGHRGRVVAGPVVVEGREIQVLGHDVQLVLGELGQQVLGQDQAVQRGILKGPAHPAASLGDKAHIELRVVGGQGPAGGKVQEGVDGLLLGGRALEHLVGDAGELHDVPVQRAARVGKGVEGLGHFPVPQHHGADLGDEVPLFIETGGLNIKADDLP